MAWLFHPRRAHYKRFKFKYYIFSLKNNIFWEKITFFQKKSHFFTKNSHFLTICLILHFLPFSNYFNATMSKKLNLLISIHTLLFHEMWILFRSMSIAKSFLFHKMPLYWKPYFSVFQLAKLKSISQMSFNLDLWRKRLFNPSFWGLVLATQLETN